MKMHKLAVFFQALFLSMVIAGCGDNGKRFLGTWSNQYVGGNYQLKVEQDQNSFLVTESIASNGALVRRSSAKIVEGKLVLDTDSSFKTLAYSENDDMLLPLNTDFALPAFKRVK